MRQNTDKSVIVYNEIDEITDLFGRGIVRDGLVLDLDAGKTDSYSGSGTTWTDLSAFGNNGTLTNGPTYNSANGGSLVFDGVDDYVSTNYTQTSVTGYTIDVWFKSTDTGIQNTFVQNRGTGAGKSITMGLGPPLSGNGQIFIAVDTDTIITQIATNNTYNNGNWYHAVGVFNQPSGTITTSSFSIYVNGVAVSTRTTDQQQSSTTSPATGLGGTLIGYHQAWNTYFLGSLASVKIYNRVLSAAEISQNYNALKGRFGL
jgi:hypothetical protein